MTGSLPLRATLTAALALLAAATLLVLAIGWQANRALSARTLADLDDDIADLVDIHATSGLDGLAQRITARLATNAADARILNLTGPGGQTLAGTFKAGGSFNAADLRTQPVFTYRSPRVTTPRLAAGRLITLQNPAALLLVARDIEDERALARRIQLIAFVGLAPLGLAALGFGLYARRRLLARIATVTTTSDAIMAGDLTQRIPLSSANDEIDGLAARLNAMLVRIDGLMQALRDVSDNIAHDLKTPINRLRITAEDALSRPAQGDTHRTALGTIIEQADAIIQTFNALLLIARLEHGAPDTPFDAVDLAALLDDVTELYSPLAEDNGLILRLFNEPDTPFHANRQLLSQAVANLIDNAIKYSTGHNRGASAPIDISLTTTATDVIIAVADCGPGIPAQDREKALKRFGRLDASRTLPGTGLGLSLVAAIAHLHGGTLHLDDNAPGLRAVLTLPRQRAQKTEKA